jgi:hypothetical protein
LCGLSALPAKKFTWDCRMKGKSTLQILQSSCGLE